MAEGPERARRSDPLRAVPAGLEPKLHLLARRLVLPHPRGGTLDVTAPLPDHMRQSFDMFGFDVKRTIRSRTRQTRKALSEGDMPTLVAGIHAVDFFVDGGDKPGLDGVAAFPSCRLRKD